MQLPATEVFKIEGKAKREDRRNTKGANKWQVKVET